MEATTPTIPFEQFRFPATRYQGSKARLGPWIWEAVREIPFHSVLDAFGGTGSVSHLFKRKGKRVTYNDLLRSNFLMGKALIENPGVRLLPADVERLLARQPGVQYPTFIADRFAGLFFLPEENEWLDVVSTNIRRMTEPYAQAIAWYALFQACISKRPYNLFHRANLYLRTAEVKRSFGNKTTWDAPFADHFRRFVLAANAAVFDSGEECRAICGDAVEVPNDPPFNLVYIDPPYLNARGVGTDYLDFYHFLEGLADYENWAGRILPEYKHLPLAGKGANPWTRREAIYGAFEGLLEHYQDSGLVISYRSDGIPSPEELVALVRRYKSQVVELRSTAYKYALSTNGASRELLIIGR